jgi:hypothetical protein
VSSDLGRATHCPGCRTIWYAERYPGEISGRRPLVRRNGPLIIEGEVLGPRPSPTARPEKSSNQRGPFPTAPPWPLHRSLVVLVVGLVLIVAVSLSAPIVAALPHLTGMFDGRDGVASQSMENRSMSRAEPVSATGPLSALANPTIDALQVAPILVEHSGTR